MNDISGVPEEPALPRGGPNPPPRRKRSRIGVAMVALGALLVVGAIPLVVVGVGQRSGADDARAQATRARAALPVVKASRATYDDRRVTLKRLIDALPAKLTNISDVTAELSFAERDFIAVMEQGGTMHDQGDVAGGAALDATQGQTALGVLTQRNDAAKQAVKDVQSALQEIEDGAR